MVLQAALDRYNRTYHSRRRVPALVHLEDAIEEGLELGMVTDDIAAEEAARAVTVPPTVPARFMAAFGWPLTHAIGRLFARNH